ncbi:Alpha/Beta hydrolase protein [Hysterangium stoloniferum]|nr:Alpha/Beta hydrolase protein [Hysterangium stoloniferum]
MLNFLSSTSLHSRSYVFRSRLFSSTNARRFVPTTNPPSLTLAASVVLGLPLALWTYKCLAMVLFQRKLIYMGYIPMGSRQEHIDSYRDQLLDFDFQEIQLRNNSGVTLYGIAIRKQHVSNNKPRATVVYFQGNAGNPLHRIPVFKTLLGACSNFNLTILAMAPRSFWRSSLRSPTEAGLLIDYNDTIRYALEQWPGDPIFLLGHSLGASIAACLTSQLEDSEANNRIQGLILENPFSSIPDMVRALYSSRWLPYHYLAPLAWDKWDVVQAIRIAPEKSMFKRLAHNGGILVLQSENDEVVPLSMSRTICEAAEIESPVLIRGALHENAWERKEWSSTIKRFLARLVNL